MPEPEYSQREWKGEVEALWGFELRSSPCVTIPSRQANTPETQGMNVTINGYVSFTCSTCHQPHSIDSKAFRFEEDTSPETADEDYIRYLSHIDSLCPSCSNNVFIEFDVWEHPAAVVNYCYYSVKGASDIQCEFNIEHYFDDEAVNEEDLEYDEEENNHSNDDDSDNEMDEEEQAFNETSEIERYMDRYDDDE
jgi:hypothetical protein